MYFSGKRGDVKIRAFWGMMLCRLLHSCHHVRRAAVCGLPWRWRQWASSKCQ